MLAFSTIFIAAIGALLPAFASPVERADGVPIGGQVR
jgi:hypothetical protein